MIRNALSVVELTQELVACQSVTSESNAQVTECMRSHLRSLGFDTKLYRYEDQLGQEKVALEAKREGSNTGGRGVGYFCHNDVVSVEGWDGAHGGPFDGRIAEERIWGRGTCDMKGSASAALSAISNISQSDQNAPLYFFITGDEECGMLGADLLAHQSPLLREMIAGQAIGIIGEPTELQLVNAHKGGCHVDVSCRGVAAHSSTAEGRNANLQMIPFLVYLKELYERSRTDSSLQNPAFDPPDLSLNFVIENRPASANITVGTSICRIFFRPMPDMPWESVFEEVQQRASQMGLTAHPMRPLRPVHTPKQRQSVCEILQLLDQAEPVAVCYATDGCCLQDLQDLIVLGPGSIEQAHRPDEFITLEQLRGGVAVFERVIRHFACR
jgi:acetylornithine deacetylase